MLNNKLNHIIESILNKHLLFDAGWIYDEYDIEEGITDVYKNYFYIRKDGAKRTTLSDVNDCGSFEVEGNYYMIIGLEPCIDEQIVISAIYSELYKNFVEDITSYDDDYEKVYKSETGTELTDECKILKVSFRIKDYVQDKCIEPLCKENCCVRSNSKIKVKKEIIC